jgi:hypothetical protein
MNLYEVEFERKYYDGTANGSYERKATWQVVAESEYDACAKIGQMVKNEDVKIEISMIWKIKEIE